jgi:hypothetical protein
MAITREAGGVADILGHEDLSILRLALRQAARTDRIGNRASFAVLYHRLGGEAELDQDLVAS